MATESAADPELSVTLPPSLSEWLEERAATLGMDRDALLVHLLETHRSAAELDENWLDTVDERIENIDARTRKTEERVGDVETKLADNVEDIRERVLQLRDAVEGRAPADHSHEEFRMLTDRLDDVSAELDVVEDSIERFDEEFGSTHERLETAEDRLDRLARAVVARKRRDEADAEAAADLDEIRRAANRNGALEANCDGCGEAVRIGLLSDAACPHCERRLYGLEEPTSVLRWFRQPTLLTDEGTDDGPDAEARDEDGDE